MGIICRYIGFRIQGLRASPNEGYFFGVPNKKDYDTLGVYSGVPLSGKLPCSLTEEVLDLPEYSCWLFRY